MEGTSGSSSAAGVVSSEDLFRPPMAAGSSGNAFTSACLQEIHFSSGNPTIEEIRGVVHLYGDDAASSTLRIPVERKPLLWVFRVPNHMTYSDFCQFCGSFIQHIFEMRVVRTDGLEDHYSVLIRFDNQNSADSFYKHFNGKPFSSLEEDTCSIFFAADIQYTGSIEHVQPSPTSTTEQPSCPVCLERLDQEPGGILTTICNHSFHCSCISRWTDSSCPVCRYCQQQPEKSSCYMCGTTENLWMCLLCGFIGCGRYEERHAVNHWKETQHCYSLELETQRVWNYAEDNYVHRLIQSKTDGKLVELNNGHNNDGQCDSAGFREALLNSQVEHIVNEYNELLTSQLESQKTYFESLLEEIKEETARESSRAAEKALIQNPKLLKMQAKLTKTMEEKKFLDDINENLTRNIKAWESKIAQIEERENKVMLQKDKTIEELEKQLEALMLSLQTENVDPQPSEPKEPKDFTAENSSSKSRGSSHATPNSNHRKKRG